MSASAIQFQADARAGSRLLAPVAVTMALAIAAVAMAAGQPMAAALAAAAVPAVALLRSRSYGLAIAVIFCLFTNANAVAVKFHGVPFAVGAVMPLLLLVPIWRHAVRNGEGIVFTPVVPLLFAFIVLQFVGAALAAQPTEAMSEVITTMIEGLGLYLLLINAVRTRATLERAVWALLVAGVFLGSLTIWQYTTGSYTDSYYGFAQVSYPEQIESVDRETLMAVGRPMGPVGEPNRYAQVMAMLLPLALAAFVTRSSRARGAFALVAFAVIGIASGLTLSRGVTVGLGLTFLAAAALGYVRARYVLACVAVIGAVALAVPRYSRRVASLQQVAGAIVGDAKSHGQVDDSVRSRVTEMRTAVAMFGDHPIVGVGPGMYALNYQKYAREIGGKTKLDQQRRSHSLYLDVAAEHGAVGLILFFSTIVITLRELARSRERFLESDPDAAHLAAGFLLAIVVYLATGLFLHGAYARYLWMFMALAAVASRIQARPSHGAQA